jgi:cytochrome c
MRTLAITALTAILGMSSFALAEGDVAKGENDFKKCKACHTIANGDEVIFKGGKTGPNLYGVIGRTAGSVEGFRYSASMVAAGEGGLVWDEETLAAFVMDPKGYLKEVTGDSGAKTKMSFKLKKAENIAAYLASVSPEMEDSDAEESESNDS